MKHYGLNLRYFAILRRNSDWIDIDRCCYFLGSAAEGNLSCKFENYQLDHTTMRTNITEFNIHGKEFKHRSLAMNNDHFVKLLVDFLD